jgi:hypothetical protein
MTTQKQNLTLFPTLSLPQKEENLSNHHPQQPQQQQQRQPTEQTTTLSHHLMKNNITATAKCRLTPENVAANANLLSKKTTTDAGLCASLKTLDRRLDKMFNSREVTRAFSVLRRKMEKDFKRKQLKVDHDDNRMYFDTKDNYVSPETIRAKYKQICNTDEYLEAKKSLLLKK